MERHIGKPLIDTQTIHKRVGQLARQISDDYAGKSLILLGVLNGAVFFFADLARRMTIPVRVDFVRARSYAGRTSSGDVRIMSEPESLDQLAGQHVVVVEDIVDTGVTVRYLRKMLLSRNPASVAFCALLDKPDRRRMDVSVEYVGFTVPNVFVVGYGMDHDEKYRNLPHIASLDTVEAAAGPPR